MLTSAVLSGRSAVASPGSSRVSVRSRPLALVACLHPIPLADLIQPEDQLGFQDREEGFGLLCGKGEAQLLQGGFIDRRQQW